MEQQREAERPKTAQRPRCHSSDTETLGERVEVASANARAGHNPAEQDLMVRVKQC